MPTENTYEDGHVNENDAEGVDWDTDGPIVTYENVTEGDEETILGDMLDTPDDQAYVRWIEPAATDEPVDLGGVEGLLVRAGLTGVAVDNLTPTLYGPTRSGYVAVVRYTNNTKGLWALVERDGDISLLGPVKRVSDIGSLLEDYERSALNIG